MVEPDHALTAAVLREMRADMRRRLTPPRQLADATELMGRLTHFESRMDERLAQGDDRIRALETERG